MPVFQQSSILPAWIALPLAGAVMLLIATHIRIVQRSDMPASRKRIRSANGVLMMFVAGLLGYAFGVATPARAPAWVMTWITVLGLLAIVVLVAMIDVLNTAKLHSAERRTIRKELRREMARSLESAARGGGKGPGTGRGDGGER